MPNQDRLVQPPKVSVGMITYNHEKFIEQAVRSVMMQETSFDYELVIGEDCSTDRTREIVLRLKEEFPDRIKLILHPQNVGMVSNFVSVYNACHGEYIALIEGDDYWTHPRKLQIQVEHMDPNTECRICTHTVGIVDSDGISLGTRDYPNVHDLEEYLLLTKDFIPTASMLFRSPNQPLPNWFSLLNSAGDWPLHIWLLMQGGGVCHMKGLPMASWRIHSGGVASFMTYRIESMSQEERAGRTLARMQKIVDDQKLICEVLPEYAKHYMNERILESYVSIAHKSFNNDRHLFYRVYPELCSLSPNGRFIPDSPRYLALASRLLGYPRALWLSSIYRQMVPMRLRNHLH